MRLDLRENGLAALNGGRESLVGFSLLFFFNFIRVNNMIYYEKE